MPTRSKGRHSRFIRLGGLAILLGLGLHIALNGFIKQFPEGVESAAELRAYLEAQASAWTLINGLRYIAFACIALFAAALFQRTCPRGAENARGWGVFGLLGAAIFVTNGMITNGIEALTYLNGGPASQSPEQFWVLFHLTRTLFTAELAMWSILILGFSAAGWSSASLPRWVSGLGFIQAALGLLSGVFLVSVMTDGWATTLADGAAFAGLAWFTTVGALMLLNPVPIAAPAPGTRPDL
ncbi:MAG: hypothetical protein ACR2QM_14380 [Longimicrobiales bacterium]